MVNVVIVVSFNDDVPEDMVKPLEPVINPFEVNDSTVVDCKEVEFEKKSLVIGVEAKGQTKCAIVLTRSRDSVTPGHHELSR